MQKEGFVTARHFCTSYSVCLSVWSHALGLNDWFVTKLCLFPYFQSSGDHPWPAVLRGHRHVVPGLRDCRALPGMAPLPWGLGVWSGNMKWFPGILAYPISFAIMFMCMHSNVCSLSMSVCALMSVFGRVGRFSNPPDSPWWFLRSLHVYLNRCHRATCPISAAPVLQSKTLRRSPLSISQTSLGGKTLSKLCSITEQARLTFFFSSSPKPWQSVSFASLNLRLLSLGHVWALCIFQLDKSGVINVRQDFQASKRTSILKF